MSYNEDQQKVGTIRHIFIPQTTGLIYEFSLAFLLLLLMSFNLLGQKMQATTPESNPVAYVTGIINQGWLVINQYHSAQQVMIFIAWAIFGMAAYILFFKLLQFIYGTIYHLRKGVTYIHQDHANGAIKWLGSLHDIAFKLVIWVVGSAAIFLGVVACFSYATLQLEAAISHQLPFSLIYYAAAYLGAFVGLRLVIMGLCFILPSFRQWYAV